MEVFGTLVNGFQSLFLSIYLSINLSVCLSVCLSVYLSIYVHTKVTIPILLSGSVLRMDQIVHLEENLTMPDS